LGQNKVAKAEFFSEFGAARLDCGSCGPEQVGGCCGQGAGAYLGRVLRDTVNKEGALVCIEREVESISFVLPDKLEVVGRI
jgi:hypothetical protein